MTAPITVIKLKQNNNVSVKYQVSHTKNVRLKDNLYTTSHFWNTSKHDTIITIMPQKHKQAIKILYCSSKCFSSSPFFLLRVAVSVATGPGRLISHQCARHILISSISHDFIDSEFLCSSSFWQYKEWTGGALPRLEAILSLSSVLNIVTNGKPWRTLGGITQKQSLKQWEKRVVFTDALWKHVF